MILVRLGLALTAGVLVLVGVAFLVAAAYLKLASLFSGAGAAAIIGATLVIMAGLLFIPALRRRRSVPLGAEQLVFSALRLVARSVQAAPEKALITALITGVLAEWFGERKEKSERD